MRKLLAKFRTREWWIGYACYLAFAIGGYLAAHAWIRPYSDAAFWVAWVVTIIVGSIMSVRTEEALRTRRK